MAYPIFKSVNFHGVPTQDGGDLAAAFLRLYPRKTKGKRSASQKARSNRRKAKR